MDLDPIGDKADHILVVLVAIADPIYQLWTESDSECGGEVYMVAQGDHPPVKTIEEIQREAEEEMAHAEHLAMELDKRKGHNSL
jgi:hypothetical protein